MTNTARPQCRQTITSGSAWNTRRCGRRATGPDGLCGHCRNILRAAERPYTCLACFTPGLRRGVDGPTCDEHRASEEVRAAERDRLAAVR